MADIGDTNYAGDGVDRSRWKFDADGVDRSRWNFDENGFMRAREAALETARRNQILAAEQENRKMMQANKPSSAVRSIDGVDNASDDAFKL